MLDRWVVFVLNRLAVSVTCRTVELCSLHVEWVPVLVTCWAGARVRHVLDRWAVLVTCWTGGLCSSHVEQVGNVRHMLNR